MRRLTTDTPKGNFETMLNFVYGNNGWGCIRSDGEYDGVPLTDWAKAQCLLRGCDELHAQTDLEIDEAICGCMMDCPDCPIALAYTFACQAVHLRGRLKRYEDVLFDAEGQERITLTQLMDMVSQTSNAPLTLEQLREMAQRCDGVYVAHMDGSPVFRDQEYCAAVLDFSPSFGSTVMHIHAIYGDGLTMWEDDYGQTWLAYRRKPEEGTS